MPEAKHIARATPYARRADFCRIFYEEMSGLYLLSFLLSGDREKAELCFVSGLEDTVKGNPVFKEWARSWARRAIIRNAIQIIRPQPVAGSGRSSSASVDGGDKTLSSEPVEIAAVLDLEPFARFVYVMTVLEHYSDQDCSALLGCARRDVVAARTRALQLIGSVMELHHKQLPRTSSEEPVSRDHCSSVLEPLVAPRLATTA